MVLIGFLYFLLPVNLISSKFTFLYKNKKSLKLFFLVQNSFYKRTNYHSVKICIPSISSLFLDYCFLFFNSFQLNFKPLFSYSGIFLILIKTSFTHLHALDNEKRNTSWSKSTLFTIIVRSSLLNTVHMRPGMGIGILWLIQMPKTQTSCTNCACLSVFAFVLFLYQSHFYS